MRRIAIFAVLFLLIGSGAFMTVRGFNARQERSEFLRAIAFLEEEQEATYKSIKTAATQIEADKEMITVAQREISSLIVQENDLYASIQKDKEAIAGLRTDIARRENIKKELESRRLGLENKKAELDRVKVWLENRKTELEAQKANLEEAVRQAKYKQSKPTLPPVVERPRYPTQTVYIASPELESAVRGGIVLLADALGYSPFQIAGPDADIEVRLAIPFLGERVVTEAVLKRVNPNLDHSWIDVSPYCFSRVIGGWEVAIAHELGHMLGWQDLDGNPYMTMPLVAGEYYGDNWIVMCS